MRAFSAAPSAASVPPSSAAAPPLTPDAAAVLSRAAGDASRRRHAHTTPLHAAAALLSGPAPLLRDACAAGLASPHPLRCRALDLCFGVALERLPTSSPSDSGTFHGGAPLPPPLSNALSAALKRAYAHHRRIGGEAAAGDDHRVGVPHLVLAILDDPSVARVMREASFSSTAVKAAMLRSLSDPDHSSAFSSSAATRLQHRQWQESSSSSSSNRDEEVAKVVQVLKRSSKRNPVLVGDTADVDAVVQEVVTMIQRQRLGNARVISLPQELGDLDRSELVGKIRELGEAIRSSEAALSQSIVVNLGNLQWLVEETGHVGFGDQEEAAKRREVVLDTARAAVAEMARVLEQCGSGSGEGEGERRRVWVIGTATCATYVKCQVHHPALESQWDIQAVPVAPRPPPPPSPSVGVNRGILSSSVEVLSSAMSTTGATSTHRSAPGGGMCAACVDGYDRERECQRGEMMTSSEQTMSRWLQIGTPAAARPPFDMADELRRRWLDRCEQLHSHVRPAASAVTCSEWNGASVLGSMQPKAALPVARPSASVSKVVDTALALGSASASASASDETTTTLARRLIEAVTWQPEAAAALANTIAKARRAKGAADTWVLFAGPDAEGKRRMAEALSVSAFGTGAVTVRLASSSCSAGVDANGGESIVSSWTAPALDRVAEAARANPFRVVVLDGLDHADDLVLAAVARAAESGRLADSRGLGGGAIFVVMSSWSSSSEPDHLTRRSQAADHSSWNLELRVRPLQQTTPKRCRPEQPLDGDHRRVKPRKTPLALDLNLSMCDDDDRVYDGEGEDSGGEGSRNSSSDLTVEHELEPRLPALSAAMRLSSSQPNVVIPELIRAVVDGIVEFKPAVDLELEPLKRSVSAKFGGGELLDRLAGAATWTAGASATSLVAWADEARCRPSVRQMKRSLSTNDVDGDDDGAMKTVEGVGVFPTSLAVDGN